MSVSHPCSLGVIVVALFSSGCVSSLLGYKNLEMGNPPSARSFEDRQPQQSVPFGTPKTEVSPQPAVADRFDQERRLHAVPSRLVSASPSVAEKLPVESVPGTTESASLHRLLDSSDQSLSPEYKAYLIDQLIAIAASKDQATGLPTQPQPVRHPTAASPELHLPLPGPQVESVNSRSSAELNISQRLAALQGQRMNSQLESDTVLASAPTKVKETLSSSSDNRPETAVMTDAKDKGPSTSPANQEVKPGEWREHLLKALDMLDRELAKNPANEHDAKLLATSARLLHVVANHREQAIAEIDKLDADEREYWKHQLHALIVALDAEGKHAGGPRAALVLRELRAAADHLANVSALDVRNLAFCEKVESFGTYTPFKTTSFRSGTPVLLYVEIDNFSVEAVGDHYLTELHAEYKIAGSNGKRLSSKLPVVKEECRNRRHDYFISYELTMPSDLPPGKYTLQLFVDDVKGQKSSQASIEFSIR